jgi:Ca2+-binding RTX toxin-like protein
VKLPHPLLLLPVGLVALLLFSSVTAIAATNTIPATRLDAATSSVEINDLKPLACGGLFLTNLVTGSGTLTGSEGNDLILGGSGADMVDGLGGNDCILAGGGDDSIFGGGGTDICLGGPGNDIFETCEGENQ